jgi:5-methylcytosine-specific restriction endonuclease McrA
MISARSGENQSGLFYFNREDAMAAYAELFKDPRWQKMRLKVLERDNYACVECGDTKNTLHVHHWYYKKGKKPWEYPEHSLSTLCGMCHDYAHLTLDIINQGIGVKHNRTDLDNIIGVIF